MNPDLDFEIARGRHAADVAAAERRAALAIDPSCRLQLPQIDVTVRLEIHVGRGPERPASAA